MRCRTVGPARGSGRNNWRCTFDSLSMVGPPLRRCAPWAVAPVPFGCNVAPAHVDMLIVVLHVGYPPRAVFGRPLAGARARVADLWPRDERWVLFCVSTWAPHSTRTPPARRGPSCALELLSLLHLSAIVLRYCPPGRSGESHPVPPQLPKVPTFPLFLHWHHGLGWGRGMGAGLIAHGGNNAWLLGTQ